MRNKSATGLLIRCSRFRSPLPKWSRILRTALASRTFNFPLGFDLSTTVLKPKWISPHHNRVIFNCGKEPAIFVSSKHRMSSNALLSLFSFYGNSPWFTTGNLTDPKSCVKNFETRLHILSRGSSY